MFQSIVLSIPTPLASFQGVVLGLLMAFLSVFLILLILIQRGRGGGLSGALGGAGGQSAFGSKAGDTFTVITVTVAGVWIIVCAFAMWLLGMHSPSVANLDDPSRLSAGPNDGAEDITSGLVVPTLQDETQGADVELTPMETTAEAKPEAESKPVVEETEPAE